ncbi:hypothetical protein ACI3L3_11165 [Desulfobaculum sp. SPO524]|uniref:hypothetical protein n=1 Tax=Desulfobaculum sp. SPO524 TaxID=3378071 RepID=UPI0038530B19
MGTLAVILGFLKANWEIIALGTLVVDKVVAATPCKWDDLLVTGAKAALGAATGRKLKVLLLPLPLCAMLLAACATQTAPAYTPPAPCEGQPSLILEKMPDPRAASGLLIVANAAAVKAELYTAREALAVIDTIEAFLAQAGSYSELVSFVMARVADANARAGTQVFLVADILPQLDSPLPISACDRALVRIHLAKQRLAIAAVGAE